ncbi:MAG: ABC transporter ATP-binding protein [Propionicimonas sp.]|uniref:ABC transporter ATP-binding protein n=1 Tax=Propionicimonas sp. TaxID=1955623 RepID=UPI003D116B32
MTTTQAPTDVLLTVRDLEVIYTSGKKTVQAVNRVSLDLKKGRTLALVGETGAGKTTIARSILGILPDPPAKVLGGEIDLEGTELLGLPEEKMVHVRGGRIAMIFQDPMTALNPLMTVGQQIVEGLRLHTKLSEKDARVRAGEMLELVGIPASRLDQYPFEFSGGMKQRVVIAMALACRPDLILADEPTTALDVTIQAQVLDLIIELRDSLHTAMLLITHDLGVVAQVAEDVAIIYAGRIVEQGTREDIFLHPTHPYTIGLFAALPSAMDDGGRLRPIPGMPPDPTDLPPGCAFAPRCALATDECRVGEIGFVEVAPGHPVRCIHTEEATR